MLQLPCSDLPLKVPEYFSSFLIEDHGPKHLFFFFPLSLSLSLSLSISLSLERRKGVALIRGSFPNFRLMVFVVSVVFMVVPGKIVS